MRLSLSPVFFVLPILALSGCGKPAPAPGSSPAENAALPAIDEESVMEHVKVLASDEYEGRAPATRGEELTVAYLTGQLRGMGVKPGNPDGGYVQDVPLVGITVRRRPLLTFRRGKEALELKWRDDYVAWTKRVTDRTGLDDSELVFVGYGIQAPEFGWDDYKGADLRGKTLVVLIGDPPLADPKDPGTLDASLFGGKAMTYYGRWTYKYEIAAKFGAAGVLIVHETGPAGYPFAVVQGKTAEQFDLLSADKNLSRAAVEGWITLDQARRLCTLAQLEYDALKTQALSRESKPVHLGVTASVALENSMRTVTSQNIVGKIEGSDPALKNEHIAFTSHWDHFGVGAPINGDRIYNGARDNATGVGGVLEIARAFTKLATAPRRSVLFLFVTGEEQGLLGSAYYAQHPLVPLADTVAVINIDGMNVYGKTSDLTIVGLGLSDLDDYMERAASRQGRIVKPDPEPERGSYYRSDHFPFARHEVPSINAGGGDQYVGKPSDYGRKVRDDYTTNHYHKPSDDIKPDWDLSGAVQDLELCLEAGYRVAQSDSRPQWKPGAEFRPTARPQPGKTGGEKSP